MRVLLVEDHAKLAMTLATGLRRAGMAVDVVFDGQDALDHIASIAYSTLLCGSARGQTVGMMAVGARAVRADGHAALGYGPALGRAVLELVFRFTVIVWIIDMLFPLWDKMKQTLHDKAVGSVVIKT